MTHQQLAKKVYDVCHLTGEFKLRSGQISKEYFDKYRFESQPELLKEIAKQMASLIPVGTQARTGLVCAAFLAMMGLRDSKRRMTYIVSQPLMMLCLSNGN